MWRIPVLLLARRGVADASCLSFPPRAVFSATRSSLSWSKARKNVQAIRGIDISCSPEHVTLHESVLESILAVCHKSNGNNPAEVFGRHRAIAALAAEGLVRVVAGKGTFVTRQAKPSNRTRRARTRCLGVFLFDQSRHHPFFIEVLRGLENECKRSGYGLKLCLVTQREAEVTGCLAKAKMVKERGIDGTIVLLAYVRDAEIEILAREGIPTVLILSDLPGQRLSSIRMDFAMGAAELTEHLIGLGHERIAFLGGGSMSGAKPRRSKAIGECWRSTESDPRRG